jgi:hypothetical protein
VGMCVCAGGSMCVHVCVCVCVIGTQTQMAWTSGVNMLRFALYPLSPPHSPPNGTQM